MRSLVKHAEKIKELGKKVPWAYKAGAQAYIDKTFPRHIFIETTAKCNLTCAYCPREKVDDHMQFSIFRRIVDEASFYGPRSFSLHLFGEPLLWPDILKGVQYIKEKNKRNNILLTTNGTHLNRFAAELIHLGVDEIIWTWRTEAKFKEETKALLRKSTEGDGTKFRVRLIRELTPKEAWKEWETWPYLDIKGLHNYGGEIDSLSFGAPPAPKRWPCYHLWLAPAVAWDGNILMYEDPEAIQQEGVI